MRRLLSLQSVQCLPTDLARLHGRLAVLGQILTRGRVVVNTETHLAGTGAHECVSKDEVGDQVASSVVRGLLSAGSGAEAESGQNGTGHIGRSVNYAPNQRIVYCTHSASLTTWSLLLFAILRRER